MPRECRVPTFLVLAHEHPQHLARLAGRLQPHPTIVHLSAKVEQTPFEEATAGLPHVEFVAPGQRVAVNWGGPSLARAMRNGLSTALTVTPADDHIVALSGTDYPLRPIDRLLAHLRDSPFRQHLTYFEIATADARQRSFIEVRHYRDVTLFAHARRGSVQGKANEATRRALSQLMRWRAPEPCPHGLRPMRGSQWCALTGACVADVLDTWTPAVDRWLARMFAPDEVVLPTLVAAGPHAAENEAHGPIPWPGGVSATANLHLLDPSLDKYFTLDDLPVVEASDRFFLRKVAPGRSDSLLDHLDRRVS